MSNQDSGPAGLFDTLTEAQQREIYDRADQLSLKAGEKLFSQGEDADAFYKVVSGTIGIFIRDEMNERRLVALIEKGEVVGELSILDGNKRSASTVALRDCELLRIPREVFDELTQKYPAIFVPLSHILAERLRDAIANKTVNVRPKVFTFIPASPGIDILNLTRRLASKITSDCNATVIVLEDRETGLTSAELNVLEDRYDLVFLCCNTTHAEWMKSSARQSERICLVADFSAVDFKGFSRDFLEVQHDHQMVDLFILHKDANAYPLATKDYLKKMDVNRHFHIRTSVDADWSRWGRLVTGRGVGIVLSGGGARSYAQIGMIRALQEHRIPIDFYGGSSMGAIIAASFAMGNSLQDTEAGIRRSFVESNPLSDYTLPLQGLVRGKKVERLLRENFGTLDIADMWLPFFCVSANLSKGSTRIHDRGLIWEALRASISLPGILPPVITEDGVLVDGGVINNLPVIEMSSKCFGPILAADVSRDHAITPESWKALINKPLLQRMFKPPLISLLIRTGTVSGTEELRKQTDAAFMTFNPPLGEIDIRDWKAYDKAVDIGYRYMDEQVKSDHRFKTLGTCNLKDELEAT